MKDIGTEGMGRQRHGPGSRMAAVTAVQSRCIGVCGIHIGAREALVKQRNLLPVQHKQKMLIF